MSRLGKRPIFINNVKVSSESNLVTVTGSKGTLSVQLPDFIDVKISDESITLSTDLSISKNKSMLGLYRTLIFNNIKGVSEGYQKSLELVGLGYRASLKGKDLELSLGFSHPCFFKVPDGITFTLEKQNKIFISGIDKQLVGQTAANIIKLRPPNPYKGKGIRFVGQQISLKAGKTLKK